MKAFIVYCHPSEDSFTRCVRDSFIKGLVDSGNEYVISDLYKMNFKTDMSEAEYLRDSNYNDTPRLQDDVLAEQKKIQESDAIVFIYPVFWTEAPAKLVGWFDRVWSYGFAYGNKTMKVLDKALVLCTAGNETEKLERFGLLDAMKKVMLHDRLFNRAAQSDFVVFGGMSKGNSTRDRNWNQNLNIAYQKGKTLFDFTIRGETEADYRAVENLVRESFWNVYRPGCSEHLVIHLLRDDASFVKELSFVMEKDGHIIGQNVFAKTVIQTDEGKPVPVLTMGPICIAREYQRKGYGKALLDYSLEQAAQLGFGAVLFEGNIAFYGKSGFDYARNFGIRYHDLPENADSSFFLCRELIPGYLKSVSGVYQTPSVYYVKDEAVEEFDRLFPAKEKQKLPGQLFD